MRVCLASAPTVAEFKDLDPIACEDTPRVPLGVLSLSSELERAGIPSQVVDLDLLNASWRSARAGSDFALHAAERLAATGADVFGLSSICSGYPLTIRIASLLKELRPACPILLGGPQATATADETLAAFPAVDMVVRGEAERTLPTLLAAMAASGNLAAVPGLTYRSEGGIVRTPDAPLLEDLDALPLPAYGAYLEGQRYGAVPLEVGRGCPFSCTFCSTSLFFGRRFRMKSAARIVEDMLTLLRTYGTHSFDLVHDNFTADRRRVVAFCEAVSAARARLEWTCSSRADALDDDLIEIMRRAGCHGIFLGIESGSDAIQRSMNKRLDLARARALVRNLSRRRIRTSLSFVAGFPDETPEDLGQTVAFFMDSLRQDYLEPQIILLSPLSGTPLQARHRHELVCDEVVSDMVFQGEWQSAEERAMILRHPEIFSSFYSVPTRWLDRSEVAELRSFLLRARFPLRWLLLATAQLEGDGVKAFHAFRSWRLARGLPSRSPAGDYSGTILRAQYVRFVREDLVHRHPAAAHALRALARYYETLQAASPACESRPEGRGPARAGNVLLTPIHCDAATLIQRLRAGGDLAAVPRRGSVLVTRQLPTHDELIGISELFAELLRLCDGRRSRDAIASAFRRRHPVVAGVSGERAAYFGLELLLRRGLVISPATSSRASPAMPSSPRGAEARGRRPSTSRAHRRASSVPRRGGRGDRASGP